MHCVHPWQQCQWIHCTLHCALPIHCALCTVHIAVYTSLTAVPASLNSICKVRCLQPSQLATLNSVMCSNKNCCNSIKYQLQHKFQTGATSCSASANTSCSCSISIAIWRSTICSTCNSCSASISTSCSCSTRIVDNAWLPFDEVVWGHAACLRLIPKLLCLQICSIVPSLSLSDAHCNVTRVMCFQLHSLKVALSLCLLPYLLKFISMWGKGKYQAKEWPI